MAEAKENSDDAVYPTDTQLSTKSVRKAGFAKSNDIIVIPRLNDNAGVHSTLRKWYALEDENGYVQLICSAQLGANRLYGLYAEAHDACVKINTTLKDLNLSEEDQDILASTNGTAFVLERLRDVEKQVLAKNGKETWLSQVKDWGNSFCKITTQFAGIIQIMVPQSPEYAVPVALLLALFKIITDKEAKVKGISEFLSTLSDSLPMAEFCREVVPTRAMKLTVTAMYIHIVNLLERAVKYHRLGTSKKLLDIFGKSSKYQFDTDMANIRIQKQKMLDLRDMGHIAQQADMKVTIDAAGGAISAFYERTVVAVNDLSADIAALSACAMGIAEITHKRARSEAIEKAYLLLDILVPDSVDPAEELSVARLRNCKQSAKDRWQNNRILDELPQMSSSKRPCLWLCGNCGNQDPWMTLFSADVFEALQTQKGVVSYVFGHTDDAKAPLGAGFPKLLLARIIESAPELLIDCPELLNPRRLRRLTTWAKVWDMIDSVLAHLKCLFLILDRIDAMEDPSHGILLEDIATELLALGARHYRKLKILITSIDEPPKCIRDSRSTWWIFLSTKKSLGAGS